MLDAGDTFQGKKDIPELRAQAIWEGMRLMKYDAVNLADGELSLGWDFLSTLHGQFQLPMVSANITGKNVPWIKPYQILQAGRIRIAVIGVTATVFLDDKKPGMENVQTVDHQNALNSLLQEVRSKSDLVILLSHLTMKGTTDLLQFSKIEGIDVAIAAHDRNTMEKPTKINDTLVIENSLEGEFLGALLLKVNPGAGGRIADYSNELIPLTEEIPENAAAAAIMATFEKNKTDAQAELDKKKHQLEEAEARKKYLQMSPDEFLQTMKKENADNIGHSPTTVPMQ